MAGNHRSWLDSILVAAATGASYTAYSRDNRVIDSFLSAMGTLLLPRGTPRPSRAWSPRRPGFFAGGPRSGVFPEGTTTFGPACLPFKPAFFQAALDAEAPVQPFALEYRTFRPWPSAPRAVHWVDWTPLPVHVYRVLCLPRIEALLSWLPVVAAREEEERGSLAARTEGVVREGLARSAP
ncbi:MAG: 1-acyl-sn-glycerol-3-phosphate acyltransferase [Chromatiales bacterium]|nr:1-acyl-sn-glycerol-3-phosphate acyltransferase [Chromatiales bacterium]